MDYANQLDSQLSQIEQLKLEADIEQSVDVALPVPAIAPDFVFNFRARRVDLDQMIYSGQIPERFAAILIESVQGGTEGKVDGHKVAQQMSGLDQYRVMSFQRQVAIEVCAEPRLIEARTPAIGEVSIYRFPKDLIIALYEYAMGLSPAVPVKKTDGTETTVDAVETFHPVERGGELRAAGADV